MMDIDSMIAVLTAAKAGKAEWKVKASSRWSPFEADSPQRYGINPNEFDYRVKPEPREWDIAVHKRNNRPYPPDWLSHDSANSWEIVHVQEVPK